MLFVTNYLTPNQASLFSRPDDVIVTYAQPGALRPWEQLACGARVEDIAPRNWLAKSWGLLKCVAHEPAVLVGGSLRAPESLLAIALCLVRGRPPMLWLERSSRQQSMLGRASLRLGSMAGIEVLAIGVLAQESYRGRGVRRSSVHLFPYSYGRPIDSLASSDSSILALDDPAPTNLRLMIVARDWHRKGLDILTEALEMISDPPHVTVVGLDELPESFAHLRDHLTCVGFVEPTAVADLLRAHDALVVPSRFDGWAVVVEEAMRLGVPVIGSDEVGAVGTLLMDGYSGLVVPAGSAPHLRDAILRLSTDSALRSALREGALSAADWHGRHFTIDLLRSLVERASGSRRD